MVNPPTVKMTTVKVIGRVFALAVAILVSMTLPLTLHAQTGLSPELRRLIARVSQAGGFDESPDIPPQEAPDRTTPSFRLRAEMRALEAILAAIPRSDRSYAEISQALTAIQKALTTFEGTVGGLRPTHLEETLDAIGEAERSLYRVKVTFPWLAPLQHRLAEIAKNITVSIKDRARDAGVAPRSLARAQAAIDLGDAFLADGNYQVAVVHFGNGLKAAVDTIVFDIDLFEQNIGDALDGEAVGYSYAITLDGALYSEGGVGLARTSADNPETAQSPTKEMHVASVSKMITAVAVLHLLEEKGVSVDDPIGPWLPSGWERGTGVDQLTFRNLMTHTSGFGQNVPGSSSGYSALQQLAAMDVGSTTFNYENANFGMFRVIVSKLLGIDPLDYPEFPADVLTSSAFILYVTDLLESVGITADCLPSDGNPTLYYRFPYDDSAGIELGSYELGCGGYGFYISARELAQLLATMRFTDELLSPESRQVMDEGFLGWMDPENPYPWGDGGPFGAYRNHGGDWGFNPAPKRGLDSCVMNFPIVVQASLIINSVGGAYPYQCQVLRNAYDAAWVPK